MTPRSGSTLLSQSLETSGATGEVIEYFHKKVFPAQCARFGIQPDIDHAHKVAQLIRAAARNGVFVCKIACEQFTDLVNDLRASSVTQRELSDRELFESHFPLSSWVYLQRKDLWAQAVSLDRANRSNRWIAIEGGSEAADYTPEFNFPELLRQYRYLQRCHQQWRTIFTALQMPPVLELSYESFLQDRDHWIKEILHSVHLVDKINSREHPTPVRKMGDQINKAWYQRAQEIGRKDAAQQYPTLHFRELRNQIKIIDLPSQLEPNSTLLLNLELTNLSEKTWPAQAGPQLTGWIQVLASWMEQDGVTPIAHKYTFAALPEDLPAGGTVPLKMLLEVPDTMGKCKLQLNIIQIRNEEDFWEISNATHMSIEIVPPAWLAQYEKLFGPCRIISPEILWCDWFGYFRISDFPWIFNKEHGWWLLETDVPGSADGCFFHDSILGTLWTKPGLYPDMICFKTHRWLRFKALSDEKVRCFDAIERSGVQVFAARSHENRIDE